jgi:hypothetical protein
MKTLRMRWVGLRPVVFHNERMANRLDPIARELSTLVAEGKRKGVDLDEHAAKMQAAEYRGGLYIDADRGPFVPGHMIRAVVHEGAKLSRLGKAIERGMMPPEDAALEYDGPRDIGGLLANPNRYFLTRSVGVNNRRVMRTRPIFPTPWSVVIEVEHEPKAIQASDIIKACQDAGAYVGVGDGRSIGYGRFKVEEL